MEKPQQKQSVVKSALKMASGTMSSRVLGLVRDAIINALPRTISDAFVVAFRLPNFFRRFLGEGSLNVSFVPVFIELLNGEGEEEYRKRRAMKLANSIFTLLNVVAMTISALGIIFMEPLMNMFLSDEAYAQIAGKLDLTILFARLMFVYLFLVTGYAYLTAVANSLKAFFIPALAPAVFNLFVIIAAFMPNLPGWPQGTQLAIGVVFGGAVQFLMVAVQLWKMKALPRLSLDIKVPGLRAVGKTMGPGLIGLGVLQVISLINIKFAATLPEGAHTYLYNGDRLLELPQSIIAISLGTALLPTLSEYLALGQRTQMVETAAKYMRLLLYLSLPCAVGLYVLARPIVTLIFQRGAFGPIDVAGTTAVVQIYCVLLVASSFTKVIAPSFFALKDTKTPALISVVVVAIHLIVTPLLMRPLGLEGLAWGTTVSGCANVILLLAVYRYKVGELFLKKLFMCAIKSTPALIVMGAIAFYGHLVLIKFADNLGPELQEIASAVLLFAIIGISAGAYFVISYFCKVDEAEMFFGNLKRRWKRKKIKPA